MIIFAKYQNILILTKVFQIIDLDFGQIFRIFADRPSGRKIVVLGGTDFGKARTWEIPVLAF
jgi:hypothetical protein